MSSNLIMNLAAKMSSPLNTLATSSYFAIWITVLAFPVLHLPRPLIHIVLHILTFLIKITSQLSKPSYTTEPISIPWFFSASLFWCKSYKLVIKLWRDISDGWIFKGSSYSFYFPRLPSLVLHGTILAVGMLYIIVLFVHFQYTFIVKGWLKKVK